MSTQSARKKIMSIQPGSTPPMVQPPSFSLDLAKLCATLTNGAYNQFAQWVKQGKPLPPAPFRWTPNGPPSLKYSGPLWGNAIAFGTNYWEPFGFVAVDNNGYAYVVFRGSMTSADDENDADIFQVTYDLVTQPSFGYVHSGFYSIYTSRLSSTIPSLADSTRAALAAFKPANVSFTGHSLGAAMCTLAVPDVVYNGGLRFQSVELYNFASPRVGDPTFANGINNLVTKLQPTAVFRIVNTEDAVPDAPPASSLNFYEHVGTPASFTAQYLSITNNHSMENCYTYAINHPAAPQGPQPAFVNIVTGFVREPKDVPEALVVTAAAG